MRHGTSTISPTTRRMVAAAAALFFGPAASSFSTPDRVGRYTTGGYRLPTAQTIHPAGKIAPFKSRPVDFVLSPDGRFLYVKTNRGVVGIATDTLSVAQELAFPSSGGSMHGIAISADGKRLYATNAASQLCEAAVDAKGVLTWTRQIDLLGSDHGGASYPCGIALSADSRRAYVCLSRNNSLAVVDLQNRIVEKEVAVGIAPYDVALSPDGNTAYVSDWGGRKPAPGELQASSSGTPTLVDRRGVASSGCVSIVDLGSGKETAQIATGLHPSDITLARGGDRLFVANSNSDSVSVIDTRSRSVSRTFSTLPTSAALRGTAPTGLALSPDEKSLFVSLGGANAVAVFDVQGPANGKPLTGWISAGWYPGACLTDGHHVYVANVKGVGSEERGTDKGYNTSQTVGNVEQIDAPSARQLTESLTELSPKPVTVRGKRVASPASLPSAIHHVVYVIKENRTYDQVFGDIKAGDGDPSLCIYGRSVTPNQHALAEQFALLDNYYCNGVISADGHSWATEGNVTDHLEKSFGGFTRSYTFGDDPLTYSSTGFLWDNVLDHGLTFRNYGEMDYAGMPAGMDYAKLLKGSRECSTVSNFSHSIGIARMRPFSDPIYPGWNLDIPDACRADIFLSDLKTREKQGDMASLTIVYLPNDHTSGLASGKPSPRAYVAENDLALGRIIEGITHSRFWPNTCIFVNEDDPQDGFDHIDGHRSTCLVISPYTKRHAVVHAFYNQTAVLHTMEALLRLPPMNQMDALSPLLSECFMAKPSLEGFTHVANQISLDETNPKAASLTGKARRLAEACDRMNWREPDSIPDDVLNRALWHSARGLNRPYPVLTSQMRHTGKRDESAERSDE